MIKRETVELIMVKYDPKRKGDNKEETALMKERISTCKQDKQWKLTINVQND